MKSFEKIRKTKLRCEKDANFITNLKKINK